MHAENISTSISELRKGLHTGVVIINAYYAGNG